MLDPQAEEALRRLYEDDPKAPGYLAIKQLLYDLRDEDPADPVLGTPFRIIGQGNVYYREVGQHPDVQPVIWKRFPADDLIVIMGVGEELLL